MRHGSWPAGSPTGSCIAWTRPFPPGASPLALSTLFPPGVEAEPAVPADADAPLLPGEAAAIAQAVPKRVREFRQGRAAARRALARLGVGPTAIPAGPDRAPRWPVGIAGTIAHTEGRCVAAVARRAEVATIGLDIERATPLPPGVVDHVCLPPERAWLADQAAEGLWDMLHFAAKEAFYKAWYPLTGRYLGFHAVRVRFLDDDRFTVAAADGPCTDAMLAPFQGRWMREDRWVYAAAWSVSVPPGLDGLVPTSD